MMADLITAKKLSRIRKAFNKTLPETAEKVEYQQFSDDRGGVYQDWTTTDTFQCRLVPAKGEEIEYASRLGSRKLWIIIAPFDVEVTSDDKLRIRGRLLDIIDIVTDFTWQVGTKIMCAERTG